MFRTTNFKNHKTRKDLNKEARLIRLTKSNTTWMEDQDPTGNLKASKAASKAKSHR
jgi:hypothetical protein